MSKHTPGPWTIKRGNIEGTPHAWPIREGEVGRVSATVIAQTRHGEDGSYSFYPRETTAANARLIAAAPELLAALNRLLAWEDMMGGWDGPVWDAARAAIRQAESAE